MPMQRLRRPLSWQHHSVRVIFAVLLACTVPIAASVSAQGEPDGGAAPKVEATIDVQSNARTDAEIARRLRQLFATLDGLDAVQVEVNAGVVTLSGEVTSKVVPEQAMRVARRVQGVVDVQDRINVSQDVRRRLLPTLERLLAQFTSFIAFVPLLAVAIAVLAVFWWIGRLASRSERLARRLSRKPFLRDLVRQFVRMAIAGLGLLLALEILDASALLGTVLGAAGVAGLAVGFALRDTVENYIASLLLSLRQPFAHDDHVVIDGNEGRVVRLTPRATILLTLDGNHTRIPNAMVYKAVIVNYTRNPKRRFAFDVGVDTEQNLAQAQALAANTLANMDGVLDDPAPSCTVESLGDSNVVLRVFGWVDQTHAEFLKVRSEAIRLVKRSFDQAGIVMPEPIYNVRLGQLPATIPSEAGPAPKTRVTAARAGDEPRAALDIARQDHLDRQIAADRSAASDDDLLDARSPKE